MNPTPWLALFLGRELIDMTAATQSEILAGPEAIDLARLAGLQLYRLPVKHGELPDTAPSTADEAIAAGASPFDFYLDLIALAPQESADCIMALLGMWQGYHHFRGD